MKILFVCHGNICRSPMAEFIFKDLVRANGVSEHFFIASAATSTEEIGHGVYPPAKAELAKHGISCKGKQAVQLQKSDYEKYDLFVGMDNANVRNMHRTNRKGEVADPWYTRAFDTAYRDIYDGCCALLTELEGE